MLNLDPGKLLVIAVVAIILLGPDRLPQVARQLGGAWRSFNEFRHRMESEVRNTMPDLPPTSEIARLARSPSALLNHLSNMSTDDEGPDGSFQPPTLTDQNGTADADAGLAVPISPQTGPDGRRDAPAESAQTPIRPDRPAPAPQPSGVVVPGDPTLN
jgi:sec-independent protein translocase protein TatB